MWRQRQTTASLAKTAALLFFIVLLIADGVVAFFLVRQRLDSYFPNQSVLYLPVINNSSPLGEPAALPSPSVPTATATEATRPAAKTYVVKSGDTLYQIAQDQGVTVDELVSANHLDDRNVIKAGQELIIPTSTSATPTPAASPSRTPYP